MYLHSQLFAMDRLCALASQRCTPIPYLARAGAICPHVCPPISAPILVTRSVPAGYRYSSSSVDVVLLATYDIFNVRRDARTNIFTAVHNVK